MSIGDIFNNFKNQKQSASAEYRSLVRRYADDAKLSAKDEKRMAELILQLGVNEKQAGDDVQAIRQHNALVGLDKTLGSKTKAYDDAMNQFNLSCENRQKEYAAWNLKVTEAVNRRDSAQIELDSAQQASRKASEIASSFPPCLIDCQVHSLFGPCLLHSCRKPGFFVQQGETPSAPASCRKSALATIQDRQKTRF